VHDSDPRDPLARIRRLLGPRLEELAGAHVRGEIPVTELVLNTLIAERLRSSPSPVETAEVQVRPEGELFVRVRLRRPSFIPPVMVGLRIEQQPDLPRSAVLGLRWWLPGMGALAAFAGPVISLLRAGPPGIAVEGERVLVDLRQILHAQGFGEAMDLLRSLRVGTREGAVVCAFEVEVPGPR
jgi:hypothetical protein